MTQPVKATRRYESPRRREQAAATRRQILEAAQRLFERDGYAGTSMAAIAADAGVALKTVYVAFETKRGLLRALWHLLLRGDEEPAPVGERPWFREVVDEPDAERQLRLLAHHACAVKQRVATLMRVISEAAPADPELAALWDRIQSDFHATQRVVVESLDAKRALRDGLDVEKATDVLWTLNHPSQWWLLVGERGWAPDEFEAWLAESFCEQLLKQPRVSRRSSAEPGSR
jgi:AcrR family transcriptional regulator